MLAGKPQLYKEGSVSLRLGTKAQTGRAGRMRHDFLHQCRRAQEIQAGIHLDLDSAAQAM